MTNDSLLATFVSIEDILDSFNGANLNLVHLDCKAIEILLT